ncbi:hypothetical protein DENSPDRAFT_875472 [Dentipellis sp. KUC8613]|nr:hypothetical protein DENSPDRAFT_875472 [Dentipellis sp. KUC8613]
MDEGVSGSDTGMAMVDVEGPKLGMGAGASAWALAQGAQQGVGGGTQGRWQGRAGALARGAGTREALGWGTWVPHGTGAKGAGAKGAGAKGTPKARGARARRAHRKREGRRRMRRVRQERCTRRGVGMQALAQGVQAVACAGLAQGGVRGRVADGGSDRCGRDGRDGHDG